MGPRRFLVSALSSAVVLTLVTVGILRTFREALEHPSDQWAHVLRHEQRFIEALRSTTSAEGDDAGGME